MCGIAGFITSCEARPVAPLEAQLDGMCNVIRHRGPDEQGTVVRGRMALGMRRLSIIDLKTGQQPIFNEDENLAIVFNGEIYNFQQLKSELEALGHRFRTHSDTEVIVHAYEEFGEACLAKLRGMFAFAIWNFREETLFVARDRIGKKPLYYGLAKNGDFVFGSEIKTLLAHGGFRKEIDLAAFDAYLAFGYVPEGFCIFKDISKLPPASFLVFKNGSIRVKQYWDFSFKKGGEIRTEAECIPVLREKLADAVKARMISEVPLGAFLSGGVDSSTVVGLMSRMSDRPVKTFSIGYNEDSFNELEYARIAARHFETEHREFIVTPEIVDCVDSLIWHLDEPLGDPSVLPTYVVSKLAREFVTVVLTGDGGDEVFGGYTRYATDKKRRHLAKLPKFFRSGVLQGVANRLPHGALGKNYLYNASLGASNRYIDSVSHLNRPRRSALYSPDFLRVLNGSFGNGELMFAGLAATGTHDPVGKLLYLDSKTYLPGDVLTKVDRMSMAASLEARAPLLDQELIEFVQEIPSSLKLRGLETKYILKKAMEGIVPTAILYRAKQGFGVPISEWINQQLRSRILADLTDRRTLERGYFQRSYIDLIISEHSSLRRDHSYVLWLLWILELWQREFMDG